MQGANDTQKEVFLRLKGNSLCHTLEFSYRRLFASQKSGARKLKQGEGFGLQLGDNFETTYFRGEIFLCISALVSRKGTSQLKDEIVRYKNASDMARTTSIGTAGMPRGRVASWACHSEVMNSMHIKYERADSQHPVK